MRAWVRGLWAGVALTALVNGCSFMVMRGAPTPSATGNSIECTTNFGPVALDTVNALAFVAMGGGFLDAALDNSSGRDEGLLYVAIPLLALGALYSASTIYGVTTINQCEDAKNAGVASSNERARTQIEAAVHQQRLERAQNARRASQSTANTLTKRAGQAARLGDCETVTRLDPQVRDADIDFHDVVFVRDAAIARCLAH